MNDPTVFRRDCFKLNCATTLFNQRDSATWTLSTNATGTAHSAATHAVANSLFEEFTRDEYAPPPLPKADDRRKKVRAHIRSRFLRIHPGGAARQSNITKGHTHPPGGRT